MSIRKDITTDARPKVHFTAKENWINDPNGFSFYQGLYHLFYQYNPKGITWGNMSWGHAVSQDLIHWEELEVAMIPDKPYDKDGVFSGSAITINEKHYLYYTGVDIVYEGSRQVQCIAISSDGKKYEKYAENPVLTADEHGDEYDFRDPKMWVYENHVYMIIASKKSGEGKAIVYKSVDGYAFDYLTEFNKANIGAMWECPDLFQLKNQWVMMFSAMLVKGYTAESVSFIAPVDFGYLTSKTKVHQYELMDYGADFYAPQSMVDNKGRRIVIGWLRMETPININTGWVGMMTLPREVQYYENEFHYRVIEEVFIDKKDVTKEVKYILKDKEINASSSDMKLFHLRQDKVYELFVEFDSKKRIELHYGEKRSFSIVYNPTTNQVEVTRSKELVKENYVEEEDEKESLTYNTESFLSPKILSEKISIQVIIDQSVAEIFINNGRYVISIVFSNRCDENHFIVESMEETDTLKLFELSPFTN